MKISPLASATNSAPTQGSPALDIRKMTMDTNGTPEHLRSAAEELPIQDTIEEPKPTEEATQPISPQFAALAKQRRALQVKEREILEKEKALAAMSQGSDRIEIARLKSDPLSVLQEAGVTYEQLTEAILGTQADPKISALEAEIRALKEGVDKRFSEQTTQSEQAVLAEMKKEALALVAQGDEFELVRETESIPDVINLIERTYRETGEVLEVSEALKLVEDELFKRNQKLAGLKKMQSLFKPAEPQQEPQQRGMRTLTNKDTASVPMSAKARAMAAFYGTLKK